MMLLGLVIHSSVTYGVLDYGNDWPLKDPNSTHLINDFIVYFIHSFRMPIFFVVAGFFGALLFYERSPLRMIKNRASRIVLPFFVFVLILTPFLTFGFSYTKLVFNQQEDAFETALSYLSGPQGFIPHITYHLWFLYYLAWISLVSVGLAFFLKKAPLVTNWISRGFNWVFVKPGLRIFVFAIFTSLVYCVMGVSNVETSTSFIPDINTFIFYFFFYLIGWILFKSKHLLSSFMRLDWLCALLGFLILILKFFMPSPLAFEVNIIANSIVVWLLIFGITGLFIRYGSKHSSVMRYLSDSSYWVYLVHLFFTALIPSFIVDWPLPSTIKFLFVLLSTSVFCYLSYHYLVRNTFIGHFLNGKRYSRKLSDIK